MTFFAHWSSPTLWSQEYIPVDSIKTEFFLKKSPNLIMLPIFELSFCAFICVFICIHMLQNQTQYHLQNMMKYPHVLCVGNFWETDTLLTVSLERNGNFRFRSISQRKLSVSPKFPCKNFWEIYIFLASSSCHWNTIFAHKNSLKVHRVRTIFPNSELVGFVVMIIPGKPEKISHFWKFITAGAFHRCEWFQF